MFFVEGAGLCCGVLSRGLSGYRWWLVQGNDGNVRPSTTQKWFSWKLPLVVNDLNLSNSKHVIIMICDAKLSGSIGDIFHQSHAFMIQNNPIIWWFEPEQYFEIIEWCKVYSKVPIRIAMRPAKQKISQVHALCWETGKATADGGVSGLRWGMICLIQTGSSAIQNPKWLSLMDQQKLRWKLYLNNSKLRTERRLHLLMLKSFLITPNGLNSIH